MKHTVFAVVVLLLVAFAAAQQTQPIANPSPTPSPSASTAMTAETSSVANQLMQIENNWAKAALTKDKQRLSQIEAPDYQFTAPDGTMRNQQQDIASLDNSTYTEFTNRDMNVRVYGDTAVVTGMTQLKGTENGKDISGDYRFTDVFVKRDGKWQAVNTEATKMQK